MIWPAGRIVDDPVGAAVALVGEAAPVALEAAPGVLEDLVHQLGAGGAGAEVVGGVAQLGLELEERAHVDRVEQAEEDQLLQEASFGGRGAVHGVLTSSRWWRRRCRWRRGW